MRHRTGVVHVTNVSLVLLILWLPGRRTHASSLPAQASHDERCDAFDGSIAPALKAAESNDDALEGAISGFLEWLRAVTLEEGKPASGATRKSGCSATRIQSGWSSARAGLSQAMSSADQRCKSEHTPGREVMKLRQWGLLAVMLGFGTDDLDMQVTAERIAKCGTFHLKMHSVIVTTGHGLSGTQRYEVRFDLPVRPVVSFTYRPTKCNTFVAPTAMDDGTVELTCIGGTEVGPETLTLKYRADGQTDYVEVSGYPAPNDCTVRINKEGAPVTVLGSMDWAYLQQNPTIELLVNAGTPKENVQYTCHGYATPPLSGVWITAYRGFHSDELQENGGFAIKDWTMVQNGTTFAERRYDRKHAVEGGDVTERTEFDLVHTPGE